MNPALRFSALALLALIPLATSTHAGTIPLVTSGSNGPSGTRSDYWSNIFVPAASTITCYIQLSTSMGCGGGSNVTRSGTTVVGVYVNGPSPGTYTDSNTVTGQPSGYYAVSQGFGGPANAVNGYVQTTFTW